MNVLIVCAGKPPGKKLFKQCLKRSDYSIAVDGGLSAFYGYTPNMIVGDLDSADSELVAHYKNKNVEFHYAEVKKNETDTMLALDVAIERGAREITLLGALGIRIDHELSNLMLLKRAYNKGVKLVIEDEIQTIEIEKGDFEIHGSPGQTVSLVPVGSYATVTVDDGLFYPLNHLLLKNDQPRGVSNVFEKTSAKVHTKQFVFVIKIKT